MDTPFNDENILFFPDVDLSVRQLSVNEQSHTNVLHLRESIEKDIHSKNKFVEMIFIKTVATQIMRNSFHVVD